MKPEDEIREVLDWHACEKCDAQARHPSALKALDELVSERDTAVIARAVANKWHWDQHGVTDVRAERLEAALREIRKHAHEQASWMVDTLGNARAAQELLDIVQIADDALVDREAPS